MLGIKSFRTVTSIRIQAYDRNRLMYEFSLSKIKKQFIHQLFGLTV